MTVVYTRYALGCLNEIEAYYGQGGNLNRGIEKVDEILDRALLLESNPQLGKVEQHLSHLNLGHRSLVVGKYHKIIYRVVDDEIIVTDVFTTWRSTDSMQP